MYIGRKAPGLKPMRVNFYQIWLPASAILHVLFVASLALVKLPSAPPRAQSAIVITTFSEKDTLPPDTPRVPMRTPPPPIPRMLTPHPVRQAQIPVEVNHTTTGIIRPVAQPNVPAPGGSAASSPHIGPLSMATALVPGIPTRGPGRGGAPGEGSPNAPLTNVWHGSGKSQGMPALPGSAPGVLTASRGAWAASPGEAGGSGRLGAGGFDTHLTPGHSAGPGHDARDIDVAPTGAMRTASTQHPGTPDGPPNGQGTGAGHPRAPLTPLGRADGGGDGRGHDVPQVPAGVPTSLHRTPGDWTEHPGGAGSVGSGGNGSDGPGMDDRPSYGAALLSGATTGYPSLALAEHLHGTVVITVSLDPQGEVLTVDPTKRSVSDVLDNAAMRAARSWHYKAAMQQGRPVASTIKLQFTFTVGKVAVKPL